MGHTIQDVICVRGEERIVRHGHVTSLHCGCASLSVCFVVCSVAWCGVEYTRSAVRVLTI